MAVNQNLMSSDMGIIDGIYRKPVNDDVRDIIAGLGKWGVSKFRAN